MIFGSFVGFLLGFLVREKFTGDEYGAKRWQKPNGDFVDDIEGYARWLSLPIITGVMGAFLEPVLKAMIVSFIAGLSVLGIIAAAVLVLFGLYLFYKSHVLGRSVI